jgi:hypothetical protein
MLTKKQIDELFEKYSQIIKLEIVELGCNPTEITHLIGRLGEFYCAKFVNGTLAHATNQHGFDVNVDDGNKCKTISVKTTAQKSGFVSINGRTYEKADELMVLQLNDKCELELIYYGPIKLPVSLSRKWEERFEFDIIKAKKLHTSIEKIKQINFPEEKIHWGYSSFAGKQFKEEKMIENRKSLFFTEVAKKSFFLKVDLSTWHANGTSDISQEEVHTSKYYSYEDNMWFEIDYSVFMNVNKDINHVWYPLNLL